MSRTSPDGQLFGGAKNIPGEIQFLGEDVGRATRKQGERDAVSILQIAKPLTTSLSVPSPPQAITSCRPSRAAFCAISVACPGPVVSASSASIPLAERIRRALSNRRRRALPPVPALGL